MADKRVYESLKFTFSADELKELGQQLARETQTCYNLENKKKLLATEVTYDIKAANERVAKLVAKLNNGYEMREVEVMYMFDAPTEGMKRVLRLDTNTEVRVEPMTLEEKQRSLFGDEQQ